MKNVIIDGVEYAPVIKQTALIVNKHYHFELHPYNLGNMTWDKAVKAVKALGDGWRLPTIEECFMIYKEKLLDSAYYWSSTELDSDNAWLQDFSLGKQGNDNKGSAFYVRAVRDL